MRCTPPRAPPVSGWARTRRCRRCCSTTGRVRLPAPGSRPRQPPDGDVATYLAHRLSSRAWSVQATVTLHESAETVAQRIWPGMGVVEAVDDHSCLLHVGADTTWALVWMITSVDTDFTLTSGPPALADALQAQAIRCQRAIQTFLR
ncbi:WYL domain-containing protein [Acrocarpospora sp. B8E8]|uniref:WYL domain-containing protein n=1 Tax=Acrocarpospora sp. B8E8 TaxID=3153572 RepID=UPI00325E5641